MDHSTNSAPQESDGGRQLDPVRITISMIARRNLSLSPSEATEDLVQRLLRLSHIRLDRENIGEIDHMEVLGPVTNLYLQQNFISKIENLESLMSLRFLALGGNQIKSVENLLLLDGLQLLDLSENQISDFDVEQFPKSLVILNLADNPCCRHPNHRQELIEALPNLKQLDCRPVTSEERRQAGQEVTSSGSEDDLSDKEGEESYHQSLDELLHLSADLISQSQDRTEQYESMHKDKMAFIGEVRAQSRQAANTPR